MRNRQQNDNIVELNRKTHDRVAYRYSKIHNDIFNRIEQDRIAERLATLVRQIPGTADTLDFGCGSGNLTQHLLELGAKVVSADISEKFLQIVKTRFSGHPGHSTYLLSGDPNRDLRGRSFDAVCMYSVLHHVPDYLACLDRLAALVRPGGLIYIDHEASPAFWAGQPQYAELQKLSRFRKLQKNFVKLVQPRWYLNRFKTWRNPRFQPEGDIHVWPDDHIDWRAIDDQLLSQGFEKIVSEDYLVYQPHYGYQDFLNYAGKVSDMRLTVYKAPLPSR